MGQSWLVSLQDYRTAIPRHAAILVQLAEDRDLRDRLGRAGRKQIENHNDWRDVIQHVIAVCDDAMAAHQALGATPPSRAS